MRMLLCNVNVQAQMYRPRTTMLSSTIYDNNGDAMVGDVYYDDEGNELLAMPLDAQNEQQTTADGQVITVTTTNNNPGSA